MNKFKANANLNVEFEQVNTVVTHTQVSNEEVPAAQLEESVSSDSSIDRIVQNGVEQAIDFVN